MTDCIDVCPACAGREHSVVASLDSPKRRAAMQEFDERKYGGAIGRWMPPVEPVVLACAACGHAWYRFQPDDAQLGAMYAAGRPLSGGIVPSEPSERMLREMHTLRAFVGRKTSRPTLLDYGSGFGRWARAAMAVGFEVCGFEPSLERSGAGARGFDVVNSLEQLGSRTFHAIQLEQVLEHVRDPVQTLAIVRKFARPDAVVRITVPNIQRCAEGKALWSWWPFDGKSPHTMAPFEHLQGFTPRSLDAVLARAGFRPVNSATQWKIQPVNQLRRIAGRGIPALGSTLRFVTAE